MRRKDGERETRKEPRCYLTLELPCPAEEMRQALKLSSGEPVTWNIVTEAGLVAFHVAAICVGVERAADGTQFRELCAKCGGEFWASEPEKVLCEQCRGQWRAVPEGGK